MKVFTCAATRRRLDSYHDGELPVTDQIAVGAHLEWCDACAAVLDELELVRATLRSTSPGRSALVQDEGTAFQAALVGRLKAERAGTWTARLQAMFDDMHFVYAGAGAAVAAAVCLTITLSMFRFATNGSPGSDVNPIAVDARVLMPRPLQAFPINMNSDAEFTLAAVVTREGRVANLELLQPTPGAAEGLEAGRTPEDRIDEAIESVMGAMSRARFEPARMDGLPVAVNMVWLVAHTTVRADLQPSVVRPAAKKRIAVPAQRAREADLA